MQSKHMKTRSKCLKAFLALSREPHAFTQLKNYVDGLCIILKS